LSVSIDIAGGDGKIVGESLPDRSLRTQDFEEDPGGDKSLIDRRRGGFLPPLASLRDALLGFPDRGELAISSIQ
jgi:hypothetical protein